MRIEEDVKLDFCDVLIKPKRSEIPSRANVDLSKYYVFKNSGNKWSGVPIIAANMDTVGTFAMAKSLSGFDMQTCLHKHYSNDQLIDFFSSEEGSKKLQKNIFYTLGISEDDFSKFAYIYDVVNKGIQNVCIDVANGYSAFFVDRVKKFRELYPSVNIMAGNVATPEMVQELIFNGVDIVKIGIGPGSVCITRKIAGVGYPQLSSIIECADAAHGLGGHVCADGGCQMPGDIAKAFGAGADFVMLGGMFSGYDECEGDWEYNYELEEIKQGKSEWVRKEKINLKFYGMSSKDAMEKYSGGVANYRAAEGKMVSVPYKGKVENIVQEILGGLRSACTYVGATKLKDLSKCTTFVKVNRTHNTQFGN
jgi:GMP reductase